MSTVNTTIKSIFLFGETLLLFASLVIGIAAAVLLSGRVPVFRIPLSRELSWSIAIVGFFMSVCAIYACIGASRQIKRGTCCWSGRRMLCIHQIVVICVAIYCSKQTYSLHQRQTSIQHTLSAMANNTLSVAIPYDAFELKLSQVLNEEYYVGSCNPNGNQSNSLFVTKWLENKCPASILKMSCLTFNKSQCQVEGKMDQCPYDNCRKPILEDIHRVLLAMFRVLLALSALTIAIIILSCLLICYNPRDAIEIELFKTGVMTEEDVELVRRLRSEQKFDYENGDRNKGSSSSSVTTGGSSFIDLDKLRKSRTAASARVTPSASLIH